MIKKLKAAENLVLMLTLLVCFGCASTQYGAKTYRVGDTALLEDLQIQVTSADFTTSFTNFVGQATYAADKFLIVDVVCTNLSKDPLPIHFQPVFKLIDSRGATYEASSQHTMMINMQKSGRGNYGEVWNPNVARRQQVVFEVPTNKYSLQVIAPSSAHVGFAGSINVRGRYIYFDLF